VFLGACHAWAEPFVVSFLFRYDLLLQHPHPNILAVYGICMDLPGGKLHLVMELCAKGSVLDLLRLYQLEVRLCLTVWLRAHTNALLCTDRGRD
jgi:hypothetical protein